MDIEELRCTCTILTAAAAVVMFVIVPLVRIIVQHAPAIAAALN